MATKIYFSGNDVAVTVEEEPSQVQDAWARAGTDQPFRLTRRQGGNDVWVNPATVAFWTEAARASVRALS
jgi:hypothetical protein